MALQPIEQLIPDPVLRLFCRYDAIDPETGATLWQTNGRGKGGLPKYVLIKPRARPLPSTDWSQYRMPSDWEDKDRKFIRAWTVSEAIAIGNERLEKMRRLASVSATPQGEGQG